MAYSAFEIFCLLVTSKRMWVVEPAGNLLGFLTFAAAATVETPLGKKGLTVESLMELSQSQ